MDATFKQLREGAKEGRYRKFIEQLLATRKDFRFSNEGSSRDSSKGIKLTPHLFCEIFINNPIPQLTYPTLITRFRDRRYSCFQSSASSAFPFKSEQEAQFAFGTQAPSQPHPNQTNAAVEQIKLMGFEDDTAIRRALLQTDNNVNTAIELLLSQPPSAAPISTAAPPSAAPISKGPFNTPPCDEYFQFEKLLRDNQSAQPDKILEQKYGIYANDANMLDISLAWANASHACNNNNIDQFLKYIVATKLKTRANYEALVSESIEMIVPYKINIDLGLIQEVQDNGWCFYAAVLTAAHKPNDVRIFAQAITYCVLNHLTNTEDAIKTRVRTLVNGIESDITVEQLVKLISIPNLSEKNGPCVWPDIDQCIGQAAAYLLNKNIIVYDESGNNIGKYRGIDSTNPLDQIYLVNSQGGKHFDIITWGKN